jgi:26S proteasome regulatory subunit, ATPase 3, interacting protein
MAPRKSKPTADDDASSTTSELPAVLKPKTEKAKVEKVKSDKAKTTKPKSEKTEKAKAVKKEAGEKVKKEKAEGDGAGSGGKKDVKEGKGEKFKAVNGEEAIEIMGRYLREQNRPYSATEISANLHGKVSLPPLFSFIFVTTILAQVEVEADC